MLLPGFHLLEHKHLQQTDAGQKFVDEHHGRTAAGQQPQQEQAQQQQPLSDVPGYNGPPYILPKLIHQTVKDKESMSCEVQESIQSWIDMNPGYTHILYDDADLLDFVQEHYPELLPIYKALPSNIERTDTWRYLVLHKLGGVYADSDVKCMQSISTWNQENDFDAALLVGIAKRNMKTGDTKEFNQFVMAAMPGHPVLATMPMVIAGNLAYSHLRGMAMHGRGKKYDEQILMRTGPMAFTSALKAYAQRVGAKWPVNSTQADAQHGVLFGTVRAMPKFVLGTGWDTLDHNMTCEEVKQLIRPEALICHQFFGTWKTKPEKQLRARTFTYGDCNKPLSADTAGEVADAAQVGTADGGRGGEAAGGDEPAAAGDEAGDAVVATTAVPDDGDNSGDGAADAAGPETVRYTSDTQPGEEAAEEQQEQQQGQDGDEQPEQQRAQWRPRRSRLASRSQ